MNTAIVVIPSQWAVIFRLVEKDDVSSAHMFAKGVNAILDGCVGCVVLWVSVPRLWCSGIRWLIHVKRSSSYIERPAELQDQFVSLVPNVVAFMHEATEVGEDVVFEWLSGSAMWDVDVV